jgi:hypothetical protein
VRRLLPIALLLGACSPDPGPSVDAATPGDVVIASDDGRTYLGYPATLTVVKGAPVEMVFEGHTGAGERFSALLETSVEDLLAGTVRVELGGTAKTPGTGLAGPLDEPLDRPGALSVRFLPDQHFEAVIESDAAEVAGKIRGRYLLECLVPPEDLGRPRSAEAPGMLNADAELRSSFCRPFGANSR